MCNELVSSRRDTGAGLTLATDGWSNQRREPIVNFVLLTPRPFFIKAIETGEERHTSTFMAKEITNVIEQYGGPKRFSAIVTDNASAMVKAWEEVTSQDGGGFNQIATFGCLSHTIDLIVKDLLKERKIAQTCDRASRVAKYFRSHQVAHAAFQRLQRVHNNNNYYIHSHLLLTS